MSFRGSMAGAAGLVVLAALPVLGQQPLRQGTVRGGQNPMLMLRHKVVQEELKLTKEQAGKFKRLMTQMRDKMLALVENGERAKVQTVIKAQEKDLSKILTPEQARRLKQVTLQIHGLWALAEADTAKELRLTEGQLKSLRSLRAETERRMDKLFEGGAATRTEAQKRMAELHRTATDQGLRVLTHEQRGRWKEMTGEPFRGQIQRVPPRWLRTRP